MAKQKKLTVAEQIGALKTSFDEMDKKLDRILGIRINGTIGFENVIALLAEATAGVRWRLKARKAIALWAENHPTLKSVAVWAFKKAFTLLLAVVVVWLMYRFGLGDLIEQVFRIAPHVSSP
jgi:hypothetical protein